MTNYTFSGSDEGKHYEDPKDTDLTHDSPHHTLGRGHTQAAPGNHTHKYTDLVELPGDLAGLYVKVAGDTMTGKLQINTGAGLTLHSPGDSVISIAARYVGGRYTLYPTDGWSGGVGSFAPVQVGTPVDDNSASPLGQVAYQASGPHGPVHSGYINVPNGPVSSTGLWFPAKSMAGIWKVTVSCYGYLVAASNVNIYTGLYMKWQDGVEATYRNGVFQQASRLHCNAAMGSNRGALTFVALVDNRPGLNFGAQLSANYDGTPTTAQVGLIRLSAEFFPNGRELGLVSGWTDI